MKEEAVSHAIHWAKTGQGYFTMEEKVNEYIAATGANSAINNNEVSIRAGRMSVALGIDIQCIRSLTKAQEQNLYNTLVEIVENGVPQQRSGLHR